MRVVVVYESMYGNTHHVANAIATGLGLGLALDSDVVVLPVNAAIRETIEGADLLVVGGPTHVHGMSRTSTRQSAIETAHKPESDLEIDPDAEGPGIRDWFESFDRFEGRAAAFDTRMDGPALLTGRASKGIAHQLRRHGAALIADPESFLVTKDNHLEPEEDERARDWGCELGRIATEGAPASTGTKSPGR
jgi:hypothetical protein